MNDPKNDLKNVDKKKFNKILDEINKKNFAFAESELLVIIKNYPKNFKLHFTLGSLYALTKNLEFAEKYLKLAINLKSDDAKSYYNLGAVLREREKTKEAKSFFNKALEIEPNYIHALLGIGKIFEEEKNLLEAIKFYEKTLSLDINHKLANLFYGKILIKLVHSRKFPNIFLSSRPLTARMASRMASPCRRRTRMRCNSALVGSFSSAAASVGRLLMR